MTIPVTYIQSASIPGGPALSAGATLNVEAIDHISSLIEKGGDTVLLDLQPSPLYDLALLYLISDNYANLSWATHIDTPATAGRHVSGASPSTNISALGAGAKMKIQVDASATPSEITIDATLLDSGAEIAAAIQGAIQALGGVYAAVTFVYTTIYTCTSGTTGAGSKVRILRGTTNDMSSDLKLGADPVGGGGAP